MMNGIGSTAFGKLSKYKKYSEVNDWPFKSDLNVPYVLHVGQVT